MSNFGYRFSPKLETRLFARYREEYHENSGTLTLAQVSELQPQEFFDGIGNGLGYALILLMVCTGLMGVAVDFTNAWRHREMLKSTADVAAHAG